MRDLQCSVLGIAREAEPTIAVFRGYKLDYRSSYKALSRVISGAIRGLSRYMFGGATPKLIPTWALYPPTYNPT